MTTTAASFRGWKFVAAGLAAGLLGGAFGIPLHRAGKTPRSGHFSRRNCAHSVIRRSAATFVNFRNGSVVLRYGLLVGRGGATGAFFSSQMSIGVDEKVLSTAFGVLLLVIGDRSLLRASQTPSPSSA
ncbi:MAG TPA: hypothetical protein VIW94_11045 [Acidimicrobiia bacterium]